jgi:hypothetical protein
MSESAFTPRQRALLDQAIALGHGYRLFALSVTRQGSCSPKQEDALVDMVALGEYRKNNWKGGGKYKKRQSSVPDISDREAMRSGDFF